MTKHLALWLLLLSWEAVGQPLKLSTYKVQEGDTCEQIALKLYGDKRLSKMLQQHNNLSSSPQLKIGQRLIIVQATPGAVIHKTSGDVFVKPPQESTPRRAAIGENIYLGWTIHTAPLANASLTMSDGTKVELGGETSLLFYGNDTLATILRKDQVQAELLRGSLWMERKNEIKLETPTTKLRFSESAVQIRVSAEGTTWVINQAGANVSLTEKVTESKLELSEGMGSVVEEGKAPGDPQATPTAPEWLPDSSTIGLALSGDTGDITASWSAVSSAESYIIELSREGEGPLDKRYILGGDASVLYQGLALGAYSMTVRSVSAAQFFSEPSTPWRFRIEAPAVYLQDGTQILAGQAVLGGNFQAPFGYQCTRNEFESPKRQFTFTQTGSLTLACKDELGVSLPLIPVIISKASIEASTHELSRTKSTKLSLQIKGFDDLRIQKDIYAEFTPLSKIDDDTWQTTVTLMEAAPNSLQIHFISGPEDEPIKVGSVSVSIEQIALNTAQLIEEEPAPQAQSKPKLSVGLLTGVSKNKTKTFDGEALANTFAGMRVGVGAEYMSLDMEATFGLPSSEPTTSSLSGGVHASLMTASKGPYAFLSIGAGGDVTGDFDLRGFFSSGVGLGYESEQGVGVRVDLRGVYTPEGGPATTFRQSSFGVFLRR
jgi:hypothetical protein